ncbi:hypothetical protein NM688_g8920 [Phlebia brevispora]|uniref:Uncharacterized protein n=1 Tax=Phlebia brevispora TaxID=194682 RepID=A0ACC1RQ21_9APHY|nr:hypothetical protein NM688_g8920 [Phlebia brevispora]
MSSRLLTLPRPSTSPRSTSRSQPFGQVPYIDDDGFILFESRAIGRYIAAKYHDQGTPLLPKPTDLKAIGLFEQAASIETSDFDVYASGIAFEKVFKPFRGGTTNEETVKTYFATLQGKLAGYERILSKQKYLAGEEISVADLFHLPYGAMLAKCGYDVLESGEFPSVTRQVVEGHLLSPFVGGCEERGRLSCFMTRRTNCTIEMAQYKYKLSCRFDEYSGVSSPPPHEAVIHGRECHDESVFTSDFQTLKTRLSLDSDADKAFAVSQERWWQTARALNTYRTMYSDVFPRRGDDSARVIAKFSWKCVKRSITSYTADARHIKTAIDSGSQRPQRSPWQQHDAAPDQRVCSVSLATAVLRDTYLLQQILIDLRQALHGLMVPRQDLPARGRVLYRQAQIVRDVVPVLRVEVRAALALL